MVKLKLFYKKIIKNKSPPIKPRKSKVLYTNFPLLKLSFGYSPHPDKDKPQDISNNLRFELDDYICDKSRDYKDKFLLPLETFLIRKVWENKDRWYYFFSFVILTQKGKMELNPQEAKD